MQRSSETIGAIAAALAKAQAELVNPEKSLTGTIRLDGSGAERLFRYAPLSSGLDIVPLGPNPVPDCLFGVLRHQSLELGFGPFMVEKGLPGIAE